MKRLLCVILLTVVSVPPAFAVEYPWQLKKDKDGIQVHVRKVEGSPILEYKGVVTVDAPIEIVIAFYEDASRMPEWFHQCIASKLLRKKSEDDKILYFAIGMPWPVSDRDAVYERVRAKDPSTGAIEFHAKALPSYFPRVEGRVRMPMVKGVWRFTPLSGGKTEVYYQQHGDAGGHIPAWLINQLAVNIPFNSLQSFRRFVNQSS